METSNMVILVLIKIVQLQDITSSDENPKIYKIYRAQIRGDNVRQNLIVKQNLGRHSQI